MATDYHNNLFLASLLCIYGYVTLFTENTASTTSLVFGDAPIYRYSMCDGTEYNFNRCQLPRPDSNSACPSLGTVNCTEGITNIIYELYANMF